MYITASEICCHVQFSAVIKMGTDYYSDQNTELVIFIVAFSQYRDFF